MMKNKSIRSRLLAMQSGKRVLFTEGHEGTIRNTASIIGSLSGRRYTCRKTDKGIMVYRYE